MIHDDLVGVLVALEQVLVLVGEGALVLVGASRLRRAEVAGHGLVRRVVTGAVQPVERVDGHHVAVDDVVEREEKKPAM